MFQKGGNNEVMKRIGQPHLLTFKNNSFYKKEVLQFFAYNNGSTRFVVFIFSLPPISVYCLSGNYVYINVELLP